MKSEEIPITSPLAMTAITPTASNILVHTPATREHMAHYAMVYAMMITDTLQLHKYMCKTANTVDIHQCHLSFWALGGAQG